MCFQMMTQYAPKDRLYSGLDHTYGTSNYPWIRQLVDFLYVRYERRSGMCIYKGPSPIMMM